MISTPTKPTLNPNLKKFWRTKADVKVLKGGRASSKTWDAAGFAVFLAANYRVKFLCMRMFQNKIQESVYAILKIQIERFGLLDEFDIQKTIIRHKATGSEFHFYGIQRNIAEIKGFEGADIGWIEEGEALTKEQWSIIEPTLRKEGAEAWILYNPRLVSDFVESFQNGDGVLVRQINYDENPFLSTTMLRKINRLRDSDPDEFEHIYNGIPKTDDDDVVIKRSWLMAAIDAHIKLGIEVTGDKALGFDVADSGNDKCAQIERDGILCKWGEQWKAGEDQLLESCKRVYSRAYKRHAKINYDSIGVGATCGAKFDELNQERQFDQGYMKVNYAKWIAGSGVNDPDGYYVDTEDEKVSNKDFFENLKAQEWWLIADRLRDTYIATKMHENGEDWRSQYTDSDMISISSDMDDLSQLITELSTPKRKFSKSGKVMVESKEDLSKRDIKSPNYADAFVMAFATPAANNNDLILSFLGKRH